MIRVSAYTAGLVVPGDERYGDGVAQDTGNSVLGMTLTTALVVHPEWAVFRDMW